MKRFEWEMIEKIVDKALDMSKDQRRDYIATICKDKPVIKKEALELLESIEKNDLFPDDTSDPKFDIIQNLLEGLNYSELHRNMIGKKIGSYQLEKLLGSGGMGAVFLGERSDGLFEHSVAIKVIRRDFTGKEIKTHFDNERQILAKLTHEGIAQLYDGGVTDEGWPYLVMEYVEGTPIDIYCDENRLTVNQRLEIFKSVCKAVQYAHSNLIIHRDLKPENILVKKNGKIKILDFGIALFQDDKEITSLRRFLSVKYASPEQLLGKTVSTSSDIYSLGLLLHNLLAGCHPYEINDKVVSDQIQVIKKSQDVKPSERFRKLPADTQKTISGKRRKTTRLLRKKLEGDLDAILQKTLRYLPAQRYTSAGELQKDLQLNLQDLPTGPLSDSKYYRFSKLLKRNKKAFVSLVVLLILFTGSILFHTHQIDMKRAEAQFEAAKAEEVTSFLIELFDSGKPSNTAGEDITAAELLEQGVSRADRLTNMPLKTELLSTIGRAYTRMGDYETGRELYHRAIELNQSIYGPDVVETADAIYKLGTNYSASFNWDLSLPYLTEAYEIYINQLEPDHPKIARAGFQLAMALRHTGQPDSAMVLAEKSYESIRNNYTEGDPELLSALSDYAYVLRGAGEYERTEEIYLNLIDRYYHAGDTLNQTLATIYNNLGSLYNVLEKYHTSYQYYYRSLGIMNEIRGPDHPLTMRIRSNMLSPLYFQGRFDEMAQLSEVIISLNMDKYGRNHWRTGSSIESYGIHSIYRDNYSKADSLFRIAHDIYKTVLDPDHFWTARTEGFMALSNRLLGNDEIADSLYNRHISIFKEQQSEFNSNNISRIQTLIDTYKELDGDFEEEIVMYRSLIDVERSDW